MREPEDWANDDLVDEDAVDAVIAAWGRGVCNALLGHDHEVWIHTNDGEKTCGRVIQVEPEWIFLHDEDHEMAQDHFAIKRTSIYRINYDKKFKLSSC